MLGENVSTVYPGNLPAGVNNINMDASNLNAGIYFVRVTAGTSTATQKIVIEK